MCVALSFTGRYCNNTAWLNDEVVQFLQMFRIIKLLWTFYWMILETSGAARLFKG